MIFMNKFQKYFEAVEYLENLPSIANGCFVPGSIRNPKVYLERTKFFLNLIGNPQDKLKFIHVTGTSGKGSVSSMLQNIFSASGKKTGLFSSPYVTTSIEKASIDGKYISPDEFAEIVEYLKPKIDEANESCPFGRPTYFEIFLALSLLHFAKNKCDVVVLEVGCGGRHDATNVAGNTLAAVITNIGLDHTHIIGDTLEKIAYEKIGILKKDCLFFTSEKNPKMLEIFQKECEKKNVTMEVVDDFVREKECCDGGMAVEIEGIWGEVFSKLWGDHQKENISLAVSVAKNLGIEDGAIRKGIESANIPCRFEQVQKNPLIILDGAHNPSKMKTTAENVKKLEFEKLILVLGISETKDAQNSLREIVPPADHLIATSISFGKYLEGEKLLEIAKNFSKKEAIMEIEPNIWKALEKALQIANEKDLILVSGSFYLAGELRKRWISEEWILDNLRSF